MSLHAQSRLMPKPLDAHCFPPLLHYTRVESIRTPGVLLQVEDTFLTAQHTYILDYNVRKETESV